MPSHAERLDSLFSGLRRAFGQYLMPPNARADSRGKVDGRAETWSKRNLELDDWENHLAGERGLGICPLTDENTCLFGAIDIDVYPLDPGEIYEACDTHDIPLILCRSKSGGVHGYVFFSEPVPASLVRERLKLWATLIGHIGSEVFPKQDVMNEVAFGNWINMPYFGGARSLRYAYGLDGALRLDEFLDFAESRRVTRSWLEKWGPPPLPEPAATDEWFGAPPCLQTLAEMKGFYGGRRNNSLFNMSIYHKRRHGKGWKEVTRAYVHENFNPPMRDDEMRETLNSVGRKTYSYTCDKAPISEVCNRALCLKREHGIRPERGARESSVKLGALHKILTEPPTWRIEANERWVELDTDQLLTQARFWPKITEITHVLGTTMAVGPWMQLLQEKLDGCEVFPVPSDATLRGQITYHFGEFANNKNKSTAIDDLLRGKPWADAGRVYFVAQDFYEYLSVRRVAYTQAKLTTILHDFGLEEHRGVIKGKHLAYWSLPEPSAQTESFGTRRVRMEDPF